MADHSRPGLAVAAYLRVSDPRQVERYSLPAQRDMLAAFCREQGWGEPTFYTEDGKSATNDDPEQRPEFRRLLADADARRFSLVLVVDVDRFARSTLGGLTAASRLEKAGCRVVSLNQRDMDIATPDGEMQFTMHLMMARYESRQKGRRIRAAVVRMRAEGKYYGALPYAAMRDERGQLAVDPATAPILERILREAATDTFLAVADRLSAEGVPTPHAHYAPTRWGEFSGTWWPTTVADIVQKGSWLARQPEPWPSLWLAAIGRPRQPRARGDRQTHMLTGLMRCRCGGTIIYGGARLRADGHCYGRYAMCHNRNRQPHGTGCRHPRTWIHVYEAQVLEQLAALPDPATWRAVEGEGFDAAAWRELEEDRRRLREAYRARLYSDAEMEVERRALDTREAALLATADRSAVEIGRWFAPLRRNFPQLPPAEQNAVLRELVEFVAIDHRTATVHWLPAIRRACGLPDPPAWPPS